MKIFALVYGQISGSVINTVICENQELANVLWPQYINIDITDMEPTPGIGWGYTDSIFTPPIYVSGSVSGSL